MCPSVVSASKSGAVSPIWSVMVSSPHRGDRLTDPVLRRPRHPRGTLPGSLKPDGLDIRRHQLRCLSAADLTELKYQTIASAAVRLPLRVAENCRKHTRNRHAAAERAKIRRNAACTEDATPTRAQPKSRRIL